MVVACDLARDRRGKVIVGPETRIACDRALEMRMADPDRTTIVVTAAHASEKWDRVFMATVMEEYMRSRDPSAPIIVRKAETFNTSGEMKKLATVMATKQSFTSIVIVVKWWHAPRSKLLCLYWLWRYDVKGIPVTVSSCPSKASWKAILYEFIGAWPKNIFKMVMGKL